MHKKTKLDLMDDTGISPIAQWIVKNSKYFKLSYMPAITNPLILQYTSSSIARAGLRPGGHVGLEPYSPFLYGPSPLTTLNNSDFWENASRLWFLNIHPELNPDLKVMSRFSGQISRAVLIQLQPSWFFSGTFIRLSEVVTNS